MFKVFISAVTFFFDLKNTSVFMKTFFVSMAIPLWRVVVRSPKIVIKLPRTNEKLHCNDLRERHTDTQSEILLLLHQDI